jgi:hypothetical protein
MKGISKILKEVVWSPVFDTVVTIFAGCGAAAIVAESMLSAAAQ